MVYVFASDGFSLKLGFRLLTVSPIKTLRYSQKKVQMLLFVVFCIVKSMLAPVSLKKHKNIGIISIKK